MGGGLVVTDTAGINVRHMVHEQSNTGSLPNEVVQVIHEDVRGGIWIGTRGGGLSLYDRGSDTFRHYREADGLANDVVYGILEDDDGFLWLSTNRGLSRFDPRTEEVLNYDVSDGLQSNEFNRWAFEKTDDGALVFGGMNGVNIFDPGRLTRNSVPPEVALTSVHVRNRPWADGPLGASIRELVLGYDQNVVSFDFAALHFANPSRNQTRYRLDGLEDEWTTSGPKATARYANLAPGRYTFMAEAANSDGVWRADALALPIVVRPPYWRTWWFMILAAVAAGSVLLAAHRARVGRVIAEERMRTRIARDLHDDVSATLSGISYFAHSIRGDDIGAGSPTSAKFLDLIDRSATEARERIGDIIWAIDPDHDSWEALLSRLRRQASDLLGSSGVEHRIDMPTNLQLRPLRPGQRSSFWLVFKEILTNVARHADATRVEIRLREREGAVTLVIRDDGRGFDTESASRGRGLDNIEARAKELGAILSLETRPGEGTSYTLTFRP